MSRASRAAANAFSQELRFRSEISGTASLPSSLRRQACRQPWSASDSSVCMMASFFWISWLAASGRPNCLRSSVYCSAACQHVSPAPSAPHAIPKRAELRQLKGPFRPRALGNLFSAGTKTSSITISPVTDARSASLPSILGALSPFMPFSKMKPPMTPSSSFAHTIKTSAKGELLIQFLAPLRLNPPSTVRARVTMLPGSEPWSGSVRPKQPMYSPVASFGKYFCFCSSLPNSLIGCITRLDCTLIIER